MEIYQIIIIILLIYLYNKTEHLNLGGIAPIRNKCKTFNKLKNKYYERDYLNRKKYLWWDGKFDNDRNAPLYTSMGGSPRFLSREKYCRMFNKDPECQPPKF